MLLMGPSRESGKTADARSGLGLKRGLGGRSERPERCWGAVAIAPALSPNSDLRPIIHSPPTPS